MRRTLVLALAIGLLAGCAYSQGGRDRPDPDKITREEILSVDARNLYDVVQRLRPRWLTAGRRATGRSYNLTTEIVVYQEQLLLGGVDVLENWSPTAAYGLEWLDGTTASSTLPGLGSRHVAGAIVIHTKADGG